MAAEGLGGATHEDLWPKVQPAARFLITNYLGFSDERRYPPGSHRGILVLRLVDDRSRTAAERLTAVFQAEAAEAAYGRGCLRSPMRPGPRSAPRCGPAPIRPRRTCPVPRP